MIPDDALDDRLGIVGTAGSGKTYGAGTAVERILARRGRCIIPDPLGVWWGARLLADGVTPSKFDVVIFGGRHGDLPLNEHAGALLGETVAGMKESVILDLSELGTKAAERRFMLAFLTTLYRHATGDPLHVIFDEADMWAPQVVRDREGDALKLLGMMETIVRRGRVKGFIPWLITQRPAVVAKDVLSQVDGLVAFKLTSSQDRDALEGWVEGQADRGEWKSLRAQLPTLARGNGLIWIPGRNMITMAEFPEKRTFDSSRTPKRGEAKRTAELKPIDIGALKERLASVVHEAEANDPKKLHAEIASLRRELAKPRELAVDVESLAREYQRGRSDGARIVATGLLNELPEIADSLQHFVRSLREPDVVGEFEPTCPGLPVPGLRSATASPIQPHKAIIAAQTHTHALSASAPPKRSISVPGTDSGLSKAGRLILSALAQHHPEALDQDRLAILAGYSPGTGHFNNTIGGLRSSGHVSKGWPIEILPAGRAALGDFDPLPTGSALLDWWSAKLGKAERLILQASAQAYPGSLTKAQLANRAGYEPNTGHFNNSLGRLRTLRLLKGRSDIKLSENLQ